MKLEDAIQKQQEINNLVDRLNEAITKAIRERLICEVTTSTIYEIGCDYEKIKVDVLIRPKDIED